MCDCLDKFDEEYKKRTGDSRAGLYCVYSMKLKKALPKLEAHHRYKRKDGELIERIVTEIVVPVYCPFCGKKVEE